MTHNLRLRIDTAAGPLALDVRDFAVEAELNTPYQVDILAASPDAHLDLDAIIGLEASFSIIAGDRGDVGVGDALTMASKEETRHWRGVVAEIRHVSREEKGLSYYQVRICPPLWLLTQRTDTRIFQHLSEIEIVLKVLKLWGIEPTVFADLDSHRRREYRTQYEETDFDFVNRMMEEAGISYYFESNFGQTGRMVITDAPQAEKPRAKPLSFEDSPMAAQGLEWATAIERVRRVAPGTVSLVDHDFRRPPNVPLLAQANGGLPVEKRLDIFEYRDGHFLYVKGDAGDAEDIGDKRGPARTDEQEAMKLAAKRLRALRVRAYETHFQCNAFDVDLGDVVRIEGHDAALAAEGLLITRMTLTGGANSEWQLDLVGTSAADVFRPPLRTPRPVASGVESAVVVGPDPNKSHKDKHGRIFVHFHWDRDEFADEYTSCWMHVSQPWAGTNYGGGMMPRPGQEVIVSFFGSDPDRPIVTGRYHTSIQKTLFDYTTDEEMGGFESRSTNGEGCNKINWRDKAGHEMLHMRAQKDKSVQVNNNCGTNVGVDQGIRVGNNQGTKVKNSQSNIVGGNSARKVGKSRTTAVTKNNVTASKESDTMASEGPITIKAGPSLAMSAWNAQLKAMGQITLTCGPCGGGSVIVMQESQIVISAPKVLINPGDAVVNGALMGLTVEQVTDLENGYDQETQAIKDGVEQAARDQFYGQRPEQLDPAKVEAAKQRLEDFKAKADDLAKRSNRTPLDIDQMNNDASEKIKTRQADIDRQMESDREWREAKQSDS